MDERCPSVDLPCVFQETYSFQSPPAFPVRASDCLLCQLRLSFCLPAGDGQVDFEEFMTILGPKLLSSDNREGFLGNTIDNIFWQVTDKASSSQQSVSDHSGSLLFINSIFFTPSSSPLAVYFSIQNKSYILKHNPICRD